MGDVKGILTRFQATHGIIILAFYDTRHAARALRQIAGHKFATLDDARLEAAFVSPAGLEKVRCHNFPNSTVRPVHEHAPQLTGKSDFISELEGSFFVTVEGRAVLSQDVQTMLGSFGELASFSAAASDPCDQVRASSRGVCGSSFDEYPFAQTFHVEFCDCRDAANAIKALNNRTILGARLTLSSNKDALDRPVRLMQVSARSSSPVRALSQIIRLC